MTLFFNYRLIFTLFIFATSTIIQPSMQDMQKKLHDSIDWNNIHAEIPLDLIPLTNNSIRERFNAMPALPIAIALYDFELAQKLIDHGANPDHGHYGLFRSRADVWQLTLNGSKIGRKEIEKYNTIALAILLKNGARTNYQSISNQNPLFDKEKQDALEKKHKNNDYFNMQNPNIRRIINETLFGQIIKQTHEIAIRDTTNIGAFTGPLTESEQKELLLNNQKILISRSLLKQFLTDESIPTQTRKKIISLFQPNYTFFLERTVDLKQFFNEWFNEQKMSDDSIIESESNND